MIINCLLGYPEQDYGKDSKTMRNDPTIMAETLESLIWTACHSGASDAKAVLATNITVDDSLTNFCRDSGCENYGLAMSCPPNVSGPSGFRELLKNYRHGVVFKIDVLTETLLTPQTLEVFRSLHGIGAAIERAAVKKGYDNSKAFAGGSCKPLFCQDHPDCLVLSENGTCRHPHIARPSMSGFGINVSLLIKAAGWHMNRITCKTDPKEVEMGMLCGLVLIG
ncbi:MAG: DUF2284 domain-containing protein [Deltaproteobacteria bacterium]|nr:DUF2284 domain-containing protein [Deltaproteobacteria bacterium]